MTTTNVNGQTPSVKRHDSFQTRPGALPKNRSTASGMIGLIWMQSRTSALVTLCGLAVVGVLSAITGPHLVHLYDTTVAPCGSQGDCAAAKTAFTQDYHSLQVAFYALILAVPALIGMFWGAPLVARELESGTFRLAWTQSVSRTRFVVSKLAVVGVAGMAVTGLVSFMVTWWFSPLDRVNANRFSLSLFGLRGIAPIGYTAFAIALGVTVGVLFRRTVPAIATTLVAYIGTRLALTYWVRPHLAAPLTRDFAFSLRSGFSVARTPAGLQILVPPPAVPDAWVYSGVAADNAGHPPTPQFLASACSNIAPGLSVGGVAGGRHTAPGPGLRPEAQSCAAKVAAKFHDVVIYQPASRYWPFQWYETAIFIGLALALAGLCAWWVRRRLV